MKASVAITAYNHERFIAQAVNSVLAQQTTFDYEIVVGEDCSTDRTRDILLDLQSAHPGRIHLLLHAANKGPAENFTETVAQCRGEYIAIFDGDDYWDSPHKLQRQVDYLDAHPECSMCFHPITVIDEQGRRSHRFPPGRKPIYTIRDLLWKNAVSSCSPLFRNGLFTRFPSWHHRGSGTTGDWIHRVLIAAHGDVGYIDEVMAVHRRHLGSEWTPASNVERYSRAIKTCSLLDAELGFRYSRAIRRSVAWRYSRVAVEYARQGERSRSAEYMLKAINQAPFLGAVYRDLAAATLQMYFPGLARCAVGIRNATARPRSQGAISGDS